MKFTRLQAGSNDGLDTHLWPSFKRIWSQISVGRPDSVIVDPFARNCPLGGRWTNDINPNTHAAHHLDALEFLKTVPSKIADRVIFDPPFSVIQEKRKYKEHSNIYTDPGMVSNLMHQIERILKPGGILLKFGYNSSKHKPTFEFVAGWILNFGGNRNDVIVTAWKMNQSTLFDFNQE